MHYFALLLGEPTSPLSPEEQAAGMGIAHHWPEIARMYAEVNQLFGDIVKVTPRARSSAT